MFILNFMNTDIGVIVCGCASDIFNDVKNQLSPHIIYEEQAVKLQKYTIFCKEGKTNNIELTENTKMVINWNSPVFLFKTLRFAIREAIYYNLEKDGWIQVHASAINYNNNTIVFIGNKNSGKTSSALGFFKEQSEILSTDLVYMNSKDNRLLGWPSAIGVREKTAEILELNMGKYDQERKMKFLWPIELSNLGYKLGTGGKISLIVNPNFDFDNKKMKVQKFDQKHKRVIIEQNIHYVEAFKSNLWNIERKTISNYGTSLIDATWYKNIPFVKITTPGLNNNYLEAVKKEYIKSFK